MMGLWKHKPFIGMIILFYVGFCFFKEAEGRESFIFYPPQEMIEKADIIATGTVVHLEAREGGTNLNPATIQLDLVFKGDYAESLLSIDEYRHHMGAWIERIPPVGTKLFMVLNGNSDGQGKIGFFSNGYSIGIMIDDKVSTIFDDSSLVPKQDYIQYYDAYYQANKENAMKVVQHVERWYTNFTSYGYKLVLFVAVILVYAIYVLQRWRKSIFW